MSWLKPQSPIESHEILRCDRCGYQHDPADGAPPASCKCANSPRWMRATLVVWERWFGDGVTQVWPLTDENAKLVEEIKQERESRDDESAPPSP